MVLVWMRELALWYVLRSARAEKVVFEEKGSVVVCVKRRVEGDMRREVIFLVEF